MLNKLIILTVILSSICCVYTETINSSPVLIFSNKNSDITYDKSGISSTIILSKTEFNERIQALGQQRKFILVLENLSPEHLRMKNEQKQLGFANIAANTKIHDYFPSVNDAIQTLVKSDPNRIYVNLTPNNEFEQDVGDAKTIIVRMPSCPEGESEFNCLRRMDRISYALAESMNDVFILTSETNNQIQQSRSRKVRDTNQKTDDHTFIHANLIAHYKELWEHNKKDNKGRNLAITSIAPSDITANEMKVTIVVDKYTIVFHMYESAGGWSATRITINDKPTITHTLVDAPNGFSYVCSSAIYLKLSNGTDEVDGISIKGLQIQPKFGDGGEPLTKFSAAVDCVGFTSPAILAGLFVTFLLLTILTIGITFILDIRTMDRFDDPKGKTITVIASD